MSESVPPLPAAATTLPRRRRWVRWVVAAAAVAVAFVASLPWLLSTSWMGEVIRGWLRENVDRTVEFSSLDLSWTEGLQIRDLVVHEEVDGDPPLLEAPLVILKMPLLPAVFRDFRVERLEVRDPIVRIVRRPDGDTNADALRTSKVRRPRRPRADGREEPSEEFEEASALPDIRIPVEIHGLTLVFRDPSGREARKAGIAFAGTLTTREGPTTFALDVPGGPPGSGLSVEGAAHLFDAEGVRIPPDRLEVKARITARALDAASHRDVLALFTDSAPREGLLDGTADVETTGQTGRASLDLRLRGVSARAGGERGAGGDDLSVAGRVEFGGGFLRLDGLRVRAEGLTLDADVQGPTDALRGEAALTADLARMSSAILAMGWEVPRTFDGKVEGKVRFEAVPESPEVSRVRGTLVATGLRVADLAEGRPPVEIGRTDVEFTVTRETSGLRVDGRAALPAMALGVAGTVADDRRCDLAGTAQGDLGALVERVRDLGFLPAGFSLNGTLDAAFAVRGRPGGEGDQAIALLVDRLALTDDDVRIDVQGKASAADLALTARGEGDLGRLLRRANAAGSADADPLSGRFRFEATATGAPGSPSVRVPAFRIDGDFTVDASGGVGPEGTIDGRIRAEGRLANAFSVLRRLGAIPDGVALDGTIRADAAFGGTRTAPQVPAFSVEVSGDDVTVDARGAVGADRKLSATAKGALDVARVSEMLRRSGIAPSLPSLAGRVEFDVEAAGSTDNVALPRITATLRGGIVDADVSGGVATSGRVTGKILARGSLADLARFARDAGWTDATLTPPGRFVLDATVGGTRNQVQVPASELRVEGPIGLTARGVYDAAQLVRASVDVKSGLQPLLDLAAQWSGRKAQELEGAVEATMSVDGPRTRLVIAAPRISVRAAGLLLDGSATRDADGNVEGRAAARGGIPELLAVLRTLGIATDLQASGSFDTSVEAAQRGDVVEGGLSAVTTDLRVGDPEDPDGPFHEPRLVLTVSRSRFHVAERRLEPVTCSLEADGARFDAQVEMLRPAAEKDGARPFVLRVDGRMVLADAFAARHAARFGGTRFQKIEGPFRFEGDVSAGRERAGSWTGGAEISATALTAPHLQVESARTIARLADGTVVFDPLEGRVNEGTVRGTARVGISGEEPRHALDATATDVKIDTELAPLLARASPLFAVGEAGTAGGRAELDLHLTARGLDSETVKRTLTGHGELGLANAYVESSRLLGALFTLLGKSGRLDFSPATVPFTVQDGSVRTSDLAMEGGGIAMRLGGDVGLDGKLDYAFRVRPLRAIPAFEKYARILDPDGWLPLRIEGRLANPKLRGPDVKDVLQGEVESLLGGLLGKKDEKDDDPPPEERPPRKKKRRGASEEEPPPPPPPPPRGK